MRVVSYLSKTVVNQHCHTNCIKLTKRQIKKTSCKYRTKQTIMQTILQLGRTNDVIGSQVRNARSIEYTRDQCRPRRLPTAESTSGSHPTNDPRSQRLKTEQQKQPESVGSNVLRSSEQHSISALIAKV